MRICRSLETVGYGPGGDFHMKVMQVRWFLKIFAAYSNQSERCIAFFNSQSDQVYLGLHNVHFFLWLLADYWWSSFDGTCLLAASVTMFVVLCSCWNTALVELLFCCNWDWLVNTGFTNYTRNFWFCLQVIFKIKISSFGISFKIQFLVPVKSFQSSFYLQQHKTNSKTF